MIAEKRVRLLSLSLSKFGVELKKKGERNTEEEGHGNTN